MVQSTPQQRNKSPLAQWFHETVSLDDARVQFRLTGNNLIITIQSEAEPAPDQTLILSQLLPALQTVNLNDLIPANQPEIYQIFLYGHVAKQKRPSWTTAIDLSQLDRHIEQFQQMQLEAIALNQPDPEEGETQSEAIAISHPHAEASPKSSSLAPPLDASPPEPTSAPVLPNPTLSPAQRGNLKAIARYLSETLSNQNIAVQVREQTLPPAPSVRSRGLIRRLWVTCEAVYSPDPSLLAEPIAQQLRSLNLESFQDALVVVQVRGEPNPDWLLRVDLTPPDAMLQDWGRWGDVQAITRLVSRALSHEDLTISTASLREQTLHLFCSPLSGHSEAAIAPSEEQVRGIIKPLLDSLAPRGIHGATVYGQPLDAETPAWVFWLHLPASQREDRSESAMERARKGDWGAIAFLLSRLLNPDLERQLATGGIRIQLLAKADRDGGTLLHVMADAPVCPDQHDVSTTAERFLRELQLPDIAGVRIYGRRAGQKHPLWCHGVDFRSRARLVPEAIPEFAASDAYVSELIAPGDGAKLRPDLTSEDVQQAWSNWRDRLSQGLRHLLVQSYLLVPAQETPLLTGTTEQKSGWALAFVWGAAGLLLALQTDWALARWLQPSTTQTANTAQVQPKQPDIPSPSPATTQARLNQPAETSTKKQETTSKQDAKKQKATAPSSDRFTQPSPSSENELPYTPIKVESQLTTAEILAGKSPYPTFNSRQLDEKLLLYYERMKQQAAPSDVLIVGSSRALRGIDPVALQTELAALGYKDISVFNFGVNGATAQVVELLLDQLLEPGQLPKLVIWADGARAFNSNTVDVTYNGIAVSPGYRDLRSGRLERPALPTDEASETLAKAEPKAQGITAPLAASYETVDRQISEGLGHLSAVYSQRDRLKQQFQETVAALLPLQNLIPAQGAQLADANLPPESLVSLSEQGREMVDFDGFLPISLQFNPATYYQKYARVAGRYDGDYLNFRLAGIQADAMRKLVTTMKARQVPVVFVNLPLTDEYLDNDRQSYEQQFREFMVKETRNQPDLMFRDLSELWVEGYDYFSDPSHLNRYGAYEVARRLAQDPLIPWDVLKQPEPSPSPSSTVP
ncbi:DUF1574 domain-containing protein [Leptolyngbya sp. FACHB-16]|uniref:DUF1574 domain-containing protein n=1 Tax=unclassified Leptolyngbya TaxID=2650499 RepID=UPI001688E120|nr:DUF1574 domain-containing protein [Leptolyngbya sp. FACHB-16]MBD2153632.1 DUF1574 domain-containing protein [Leptolyngbya sp. FACHB-16]